ncbi:MAG: IPT/TIG domain-containing protein [Elusimicrobia bacterium]|nr:IPT/TIG domain-containing protein [Elusimicrobiota bacterium]
MLPGATTVASRTDTSFNISWDPHGNPSGTLYEVRLGTGPSGTLCDPSRDSFSPSSFTTTNPVQLTGLQPNTNYVIQVCNPLLILTTTSTCNIPIVVATRNSGTEPNPQFFTCGGPTPGNLAAALDPSGKLWQVSNFSNSFSLTRNSSNGSTDFSVPLAGAAMTTGWNLGFDGSGNAYTIATSSSGATIYKVSPQGSPLSTTNHPPLDGQATAVDSDGTNLWIAGASNGSAALWQASPSGLPRIGLFPGATAQAILADGSGPIWLAGATRDVALWRYDPSNGNMVRFDWTNSLGGTGSSAQALLEDTAGNIWLSGWAHTQTGTVAALWQWDGSAISLVATSTGTYSDQAQGLDLDSAGRFWLTGRTQLDSSGNTGLAVWQYPAEGGSTLNLVSSYPSYPSAAPTNTGNILTIFGTNLNILGTDSDGTYKVWSQILALADISGVLNYADAFTGGSVYFLASNTPDFQNPQSLGFLPAPNSGTVFNYTLTGLPSPATYYIAAAYDRTGYIAAGGQGLGPGNPLGGNLSAPVFLGATPATAPAISLAVDQQAPSLAILAPVNGSTIPAAMLALSGTASDNIGISDLTLAVANLTDGTWLDPYSGVFISTPGALWNHAARSGPMNNITWSGATPPVLGGEKYAIYAQAMDPSGNVSTAAVSVIIKSTNTAEAGYAVALGRDGSGNIWTVTQDYDGQTPTTMSVRKHDSAGNYLAGTVLPDAVDSGNFGIGFGPSGNWVGGTNSSGLAVWKVAGTGQVVQASVAYAGANGFIYSGGVVVDGSGNAWLAGAEQTSQNPTFRFGLWKYNANGSLAPGFPKNYQRSGGSFDGGLATNKDSSGNTWSAGISSDPVTGHLDLALWKYASNGSLAAGFPVFWPQAFANVQDNLVMGLRVSQTGTVWVAASKAYPNCAATDLALLRFDSNGVLVSTSLWHNAAGTSAAAKALALDPAGNPWVVGNSSTTSAVWKYDSSGNLAAGYPKTDPDGFDNDLIAVDGAGTPWVVDSADPEVFFGNTAVAGAPGPNACALGASATISGTITKPLGFAEGANVMVVYSTTGFNEQPQMVALTATAGTMLPYSLSLPAPASYWIAAFEGTSLQFSSATPMGFYNHIAGIPVLAGSSISNADFSIAPDTVPPSISITSIVNGSTVSALNTIQGTVQDAVALNGSVDLAVRDLATGLWWSGQAGHWAAASAPVYLRSNGGPLKNSVNWSAYVGASPTSGDILGNLGGYLAQGRNYAVYARGVDLAGNETVTPVAVTFTWEGPTGNVAPLAPAWITAQVLGTSSIVWTWAQADNALGYSVYRSTAGSKQADVIASSFTLLGQPPNSARSRCVTATNASGESPIICSSRVYTLAAVPSQLQAVSVSSYSITWAWDASSNPAGTDYALAVSTDGSVADLITLQSTGTTVFGLAPGTSYFARIRASNGDMIASSFSEVASTQTLAVVAELAVVPSSGPIGIPFTIAGTGFGAYSGSNTRVKFGTASAPISVWNDTTIQGTIPGLSPGAYSVAVERQTSSSVTATSAGLFTVNLPSASIMSPLAGPIGVPFAITGESFGPYNGSNTRVKIGGVAAPISVWNDHNIQGTIPNALAGIRTVTIERATSDGGLASVEAASFLVSVPAITDVQSSSGPIGISLTVLGTSFGPYNGSNTRLRVDGAAAAVSVWNDTRIVATVPDAPAGLAPVVVERATSDGGLSASDTAYFLITTASVTVMTPSAGPIGVPFTITGTSFGTYRGTSTRVKFGSTAAPISVWNDSTIQGTVPALDAGAYGVLIELQAGTTVATSAAGTFTVMEPAVATINPSTGPIGIPFTIAGTGFGPYNGSNTRVKFGAITAPVSVWNDTLIQGTIPGLAAGGYAVTVERQVGTGLAQSNAGTFTVSLPQVSTMTPVLGPIGLAFTLNGASFGSYNGANTKVLVGGVSAPISVWNDALIQGTIPGAVPSGDQPVVVQRQTADGGLAQSATIYFTVTGPVITAINPSTGPIGISFSITGTNFGTYNGPNTRVRFGSLLAPIGVWNNTLIQGTIPGLSSGTYAVSVERQAGPDVALSNPVTFLVVLPQISTVTPMLGPIGIPFTITGSGFGAYNGANTKVKFGTIAAPISVWNDSTIQGTIPGLTPGDYAVSVERQAGTGLAQGDAGTFSVILPQVSTMTPVTGPIGVPFTVTGTGFGAYNGSNTRLKFNGIVAPISVWNNTTIQGRVPGQVSTGTQTVLIERATADGGLADSAAQSFNVVLPQISQVIPAQGQPGGAFELDGSGFGPYNGSATKVTFSGTAAGISVWNDAMIRGVIPASLSVGTYTVVVALSPSGGTAQSNVLIYGVGTSGTHFVSMSLAAAAPAPTYIPTWYGQASLPLDSEEGGTVVTPSRVAVVVPPGALSQTTDISIDRAEIAGADSEVRLRTLSAVSLAPAGDAVQFGPEGTNFAVPVTIELPYDPAAILLGQAGKVAVHYWNPASHAWLALPSQVDASRRVVSALTDHFSLYQALIPALAAAQATSTVAEMQIACNPLRQSCSPMQFKNLPVSARLRIYTLSGAMVKDLNADALGQATWDGTNQSGAWVASGVYFVFAQGNGTQKTFKVGVQR